MCVGKTACEIPLCLHRGCSAAICQEVVRGLSGLVCVLVQPCLSVDLPL